MANAPLVAALNGRCSCAAERRDSHHRLPPYSHGAFSIPTPLSELDAENLDFGEHRDHKPYRHCSVRIGLIVCKPQRLLSESRCEQLSTINLEEIRHQYPRHIAAGAIMSRAGAAPLHPTTTYKHRCSSPGLYVCTVHQDSTEHTKTNPWAGLTAAL